MVLVVLLLRFQVAPVAASHSLPSPPTFWDQDFNGQADEPNPYRFGGSQWSDKRENRAREAMKAWRDETDFRARIDVDALNAEYIYIDGRVPECDSGWGSGLARTCVYTSIWSDHKRIHGANIYFNTNEYDWHYSLDGTPVQGDWDFRGILTHELGHSVRLRDLSPGEYDGSYAECDPGALDVETMCGAILHFSDSFRRRSLELDDRIGANSVYP